MVKRKADSGAQADEVHIHGKGAVVLGERHVGVQIHGHYDEWLAGVSLPESTARLVMQALMARTDALPLPLTREGRSHVFLLGQLFGCFDLALGPNLYDNKPESTFRGESRAAKVVNALRARQGFRELIDALDDQARIELVEELSDIIAGRT